MKMQVKCILLRFYFQQKHKMAKRTYKSTILPSMGYIIELTTEYSLVRNDTDTFAFNVEFVSIDSKWH